MGFDVPIAHDDLLVGELNEFTGFPPVSPFLFFTQEVLYLSHQLIRVGVLVR
jgi:hypothetical protein